MSDEKPKRGFAALDPERQRELARQGGASVPRESRSFSQDRNLAAEAGRKGGQHSSTRSFSTNRNLAVEAGRKGGKAARKKRDENGQGNSSPSSSTAPSS